MGIEDLTKTIKKHAPEAITNLQISDLPGQIYGVDVYSYLYPSKYNSTAKGKGSHIRFFLDMILKWKNCNKTLIMVFDGDTHSILAKAETAKQRSDAKTKMKETLTLINDKISQGTADEYDYIELEKATRNNIKILDTDLDDLKHLFKLTSTNFICAKGEADHCLSALFSKGIIHGAISEDSDMLTHGINYVIRGIIDWSLRSSGTVNLYNLSEILKKFNMSMEEFIDFCILSGSDYCAKIPRIGSITAFNLIKKHKSVHSIIELNEYNIPDDYTLNYERAVKMFKTMKDEEDVSLSLTDLKNSDDEFLAWLKDKTNYSQKSFDIIFPFIPFPKLEELKQLELSVLKTDTKPQEAKPQEVIPAKPKKILLKLKLKDKS
jgi:flap endonuclease-1